MLMVLSVIHAGVSSVALEGKDRDQVVATGEDVDAVCLAKVLRKKFGHATIESVEDVKDKKEEKEEKPKELLYCYRDPFPYYATYHDYYDSDNRICTIM